MAFKRTALRYFITSNALYASATVSVYTIDSAGAKTTTLATLYAAETGSSTIANPVTLDSEGKFPTPPYVEVEVIASISNATVDDHDTPVFRPGLSDADVAAVAANLALTNADVVSTNADVVLTNADVVSTNADVVLTNADVVSAAAQVTLAAAQVTLAEAQVTLAEAAAAAAVDNVFNGNTVGGTADAVTVTCTPTMATLATGNVILFTPTSDCTGPATLKPDALAVDSVVDREGDALFSQGLKSGVPTAVRFDGTNWVQLTEPPVRTGIVQAMLFGGM